MNLSIWIIRTKNRAFEVETTKKLSKLSQSFKFFHSSKHLKYYHLINTITSTIGIKNSQFDISTLEHNQN